LKPLVSRQAHREIALAHALHARLQARDGRDDHIEEQVDDADRAHHGQRQQHQLRAAQPERAGFAVAFDLLHQGVGGRHKTRGAAFQHACVGRAQALLAQQRAGQRRQLLAPLALHQLEIAADGGGRRQEQRAARVAVAQLAQRVADQAGLQAHFLARRRRVRPGRDIAQKHTHAIAVHAQAAGHIDGRGAAFELPGQQQRGAYHHQGHGQEAQQHADDARRQALPGREQGGAARRACRLRMIRPACSQLCFHAVPLVAPCGLA
jgi:hypothetical protein